MNYGTLKVFHGQACGFGMVYPFYYLSRKWMKSALQGITLDIILISIPCFIYILSQSDTLSLVTQEYRYWLLLPALGIVSAISLSAN